MIFPDGNLTPEMKGDPGLNKSRGPLFGFAFLFGCLGLPWASLELFHFPFPSGSRSKSPISIAVSQRNTHMWPQGTLGVDMDGQVGERESAVGAPRILLPRESGWDLGGAHRLRGHAAQTSIPALPCTAVQP